MPRRLLEVAAIVVLVAELSATARPLVRTMPAIDYLRPPAIAREIRSGPGRLFSNQAYRAGREELVVNAGNVIENSLRAPLDRLHSRTANLFDKSYALDVDFDLTFTRPAARALAFYERLRDEPDLAHRMLGAWSVEQVLIGRAPEAMIADIRHGRSQPAHVSIAPNGYYLPQIRFIPRYRAFGTAGRAEAAAFKARIPLNREEFLIEPVHAAADDGLPVELSVGRLLKDEDRADQRTIEYASESPALLVVATTFDRRWRAAIAARRLPIFETAGGYMAIPVPAGEHRLELEFRDPWFAVGAAVTLLAALLLVLVAFVPRARPAAPEPRRTMP